MKITNREGFPQCLHDPQTGIRVEIPAKQTVTLTKEQETAIRSAYRIGDLHQYGFTVIEDRATAPAVKETIPDPAKVILPPKKTPRHEDRTIPAPVVPPSPEPALPPMSLRDMQAAIHDGKLTKATAKARLAAEQKGEQRKTVIALLRNFLGEDR